MTPNEHRDTVDVTATPTIAGRSSPEPGATPSTATRTWADVRVARRQHALIDLDAPATLDHLVVIHLNRSQEVVGEIHGGLRLRTFSRAGLKIIPAGRSSEWHWRPRRPASDSLHIHLSGRVLGRAAAAAGQDPDALELVEYFGELGPGIASVGAAFQRELHVAGAAEDLYAEALTNSLAVLLLRGHSTFGTATRRSLAAGAKGALSHRTLRTATDYVADHLHSRSLSVADLARATGYSPHHFARLFRASTGTPPHQYIIRCRVERAREMLETTGHSLGTVAAVCGFSHQAHMTRQFRRLLGVTPGEYRAG